MLLFMKTIETSISLTGIATVSLDVLRQLKILKDFYPISFAVA